MRHDIESCDQGGEDKTRLGLMDQLQAWRASRRLWSDGPRGGEA